ncbi:efflux RND transporter periplasmic adaptor subunit [Silvibacterium dinghuense]|uniref:HlyD family efflux transporter periplasmic adaptor subunit n=1 Tax=Silvibacterium dinghuense TaxID=1560006 RepID=A0A4Q1SE16_9BACT|nr:efflux RND transporter periplasmic adaptor subunit [Silvibacterium dinghuense]RXS95492.1 HlyD family efflux transporter periplasmic adaptor subunit [Silvibacterium dinghuense]GGH13564.1 RND transporter [Silvibacterium dinghuense]
MDIARPDIKKKKLRRNAVWIVIGVVALAAVAFFVYRLKPAAPPVDASTIWPDTVKRGPLVVQVHGLGTLVPREDSIELIPAQTDATVVRIRVLPGTKVTPDTILMDLADPELEQQLLSAQLALKGAEADYKSLQATLESTLMDKKTAAAQVNADYSQDQLQAQTDKKLYELGVISGLAYSKSKGTADQLTTQHDLSQQQLEVNRKAIEVQLASSQAKIDQAKAQLALYEKQSAALQVKAGISGVLAPLATPVQVGQHVAVGTSVAEVVQLDKLKAALQIAETQAHDIQLGQPAEVDTHNGIVQGHVIRIDPSVVNGTRTVDVSLDGALPPGAVPQLSVDGTIDQERLQDVLYVGRPAFGNPDSTISLFRIDADGKTATRVQVKVGKASVTEIQILNGLKEGDRVILSDMSRYDATDKVRLD